MTDAGTDARARGTMESVRRDDVKPLPPSTRTMPDPYRVLFPIGIAAAFVALLPWVAQALSGAPWWPAALRPAWPGPAHAAIMMQGFELAFVCGFLLTAMPAFTHGARATRMELGVVTTGVAAFTVLRALEVPGAAIATLVTLLALVMLQPDLGTAIVMSVIVVSMISVAGAKGRHLAIIAIVGLIGVVGVVEAGFLKQYQVNRLTSFLDQSKNKTGATYNLDQSKTAPHLYGTEKYPESYGTYGFTTGLNPSKKWRSDYVIGIDLGQVMLNIENARDNAPHKWMMSQPRVKRAFKKIGLNVTHEGPLDRRSMYIAPKR